MKKIDTTVTDDDPVSDEEDDEESKQDSHKTMANGTKSQRPNAGTPPQRTTAKSQWQQKTAQFCLAMLEMNALNMKQMIEAMTATNAVVAATGSPLSKLSTTRRTVLEACAGHDDEEEEFELPQMYMDLEAAGWTVDGTYMALRWRCVEVAGSRH